MLAALGANSTVHAEDASQSVQHDVALEEVMVTAQKRVESLADGRLRAVGTPLLGLLFQLYGGPWAFASPLIAIIVLTIGSVALRRSTASASS